MENAKSEVDFLWAGWEYIAPSNPDQQDDRSISNALITRLASKIPAVRRSARKELVHNINASVAELAELLTHRHAKVRMSAVIALSKRIPDITQKIFEKIFSDTEPCVIDKVITLFGCHEPILEQEKLFPFLRHPSENVRAAVIKTLSARDNFNIALIVPALDDVHQDVRSVALNCLANRHALSDQQIAAFLYDNHREVRIVALKCLARRQALSDQQLAACLDDNHHEVRAVALKCLANKQALSD